MADGGFVVCSPTTQAVYFHGTAIYWLRIMWLTGGETRNDQETPDPRSVDADRFHCVGPRRRDLHLAQRRSRVEINLWRSCPHESSGNKEGPDASRGDRRFSSHGDPTVRRMR